MRRRRTPAVPVPATGVSSIRASASGGSGLWWEATAALALLLVSLAIVLRAPGPGADPDLWARMATGKLIVESGRVPTVDPFSYMPKRPVWIDHEWAAGLVFYLTAALSGQAAILALKALLLFGVIWFMYRRASLLAGRPASLTFFALMTAALMFGFASTVRSQAFTFFLFSAWFHLLERAWRGDWRGGPVILLTAAPWANLHGGFLSGIGLIAIFAASAVVARARPGRFIALGAGASAASLLNPWGISYWNYLLEAVTMDRPGVSEWTPMRLLGNDPLGHGFRVVLVLTLVVLAAHAARRRRIDLPVLLGVLVTMALALSARRHVTFFVIAAVPFVWSALAPYWQEENEGPLRWASRIAFVSLGLAAATTTPWRIPILRGYPADAVDFIEQTGLRGNLLIGFNTGSYAIWRLYPSVRVSLDGRYETVYTDETVTAVGRFLAGAADWSRILESYPHTIAMIPRGTAVEGLMRTRSDWRLAFTGQDDLVFVRSDVVVAPSRPEPEPPRPTADPFATSPKPRFAPAP